MNEKYRAIQRFDRARLPALDRYCQAAGLTLRSRPGNVQRWDSSAGGD